METLLVNLAGKPRRVVQGGREYLVASATSIVPGVLPGSEGALLYLPDDISANVSDWDTVPLTHSHPTDQATGKFISATAPGVLDQQGIGFVRDSAYQGKLTHQVWFDVANVKAADLRFQTDVYDRLLRGEPIEVSTGLHVDREPAPAGAVHNGTAYTHIARRFRPDHIAVLPTAKGACPVERGCGVNNQAAPSLLERIVAWLVGNAKGMPSDKADITPEKACQMLKDGTAHGHPLTDAQKGMLGAICGEKDKGTNNAAPAASEVSTMTPEQRKAAVDLLVANCQCDGDKEAIAKLSDATLAKLAAPPATNAAPAKPTVPPPDKPAPTPTPAPQPAPSKPLTANEWLAMAPPEVQERDRMAQRILDGEKRKLVDRLTANVADAARKQALATNLMGKTYEDLLERAELLPPPAEANAPAPSYLGAAGAPPVGNAKDDSQNLLPDYEIDWSKAGSAA